MDAILNQSERFKERWGVEPQYIDRTRHGPQELFEDNSEHYSEEVSELIPEDFCKFVELAFFKPLQV